MDMLKKLFATLIIFPLAACPPASRPPAVDTPTSKPAPASAPAAASSDTPAQGDDQPDLFAAGAADELALDDSDGSSSLRSRLRLAKMEPDMVLVELTARVAGQTFPSCAFLARVLKEAASKKKHLRLLGRGKTYRFAPALVLKGGQPDLADAATRRNLGACYHAPGTKLVIKVGGVDRAAKQFSAAAIHMK